jgi:hypothetical protein
VPESIHGSRSAGQAVRDGIAAAGRRRRVRAASARLWRAALRVAAGALLVAALTRLLSGPAALPVALLLSGAVALAIYALVIRRPRPVSDAEAAALDADANLRGELRSAAWFAASERRDDWAELHLQRAADRIQSVNWQALYPPLRARRAQVATLALLLGTLALSLTMPERALVQPGAVASAAQPAPLAAPATQILDPELQKMLEDLLAAAANGRLPDARAMATDTGMRALLDTLGTLTDRELLEALKQALAANPDIEAATAAQNLKTLAADARKTMDVGEIPKETLAALEKLSEDVEIVQAQEAVAGDSAESAASGEQVGQLGKPNEAGAAQELSIQFAAESDASAGAALMMMSEQASQQIGGPPGAGTGGAGSADAAATGPGIEAALKQETVEASQDSTGDNVETEIRRQTEHGDATVAFTGTAAGAFDRTRAVVPPRVPEARRPGVQTYFVRKP